MIYLISIYCLFFALLTYRKTDWAIYLIVTLLPSYLIRFSFFNIPMTLLEAMILILALVWFIKSEFNWPAIRQNKFFWPIVAVLFFSTVSVFTSPDTIKALGIWKAYFIEPILFFAILISALDKKQLKNIFWALGVSALYLSTYAILQKFSGFGVPTPYLTPDGAVDRVVSIFSYPNALGLYLGPIIILFTGFLFQGKHKILKLLVIILGLIAIILAKSEGALIAVLIVWLLWMLVYQKTRLIAVAIILIGAIIILANPVIIEKITLQDYSGMIRWLIWNESWEMLKNNPLTGAGLFGYQTKIAPYHQPTFEIFLYPHNIVLNFWSELGILGLLSFIWLIGSFLWQNIKTKKISIINLTLIAVMLQIIIHGLVDAPYFKNDLSVLFWIIIGISVIMGSPHTKTEGCRSG